MLSLTAENRLILGKELVASRADGKLPVVLYGPKAEPVNLFVETKLFKKVLASAGESSLVSIKTEAGTKEVLIHEVSFHPVSGEPIHADLYMVDQAKPIQVAVHLEYEGEAPAEKLGGILVKVLHELEIEALPKDLPNHITVDVTKLTDLDSQILIKDLVLPAGVTSVNDVEGVVAAISVAVDEPEAPAEAVDLSAIEVEKKGKKEEETPAE